MKQSSGRTVTANRIFSPWVPALLLLPFIFISFFARPAADDLFLHYLGSRYPLEEVIFKFYNRHSSRYFSVPLLMWMTSGKFLLQHYYLVPLGFFSLFTSAAFYLFQTLNRCLLGGRYTRMQVLACALYFLLLYLQCMPEVSSGFYWLSAAVTHTCPAIALLWLAGTLVQGITKGLDRETAFVLSAALFVIFGTSELTALMVLSLLTGLIILGIWRKTHWLPWVAAFTGAALVLSALLFFSGGNQERANFLAADSSALYATGAAYLRFFLVAIPFLQTPFTYAFILLVVVIFSRTGPYHPPLPNRSWWPLVWLLFPFLVYFFAYYFNDAGVPPRANNPVLMGIMLLCFAMLAHGAGSFYRPLGSGSMFRVSGYLFVLSVCIGPIYIKALSHMVTGPVYAHVYDDRIQRIRAAKAAGSTAIELPIYDSAFSSGVQAILPRAVQRPVLKLTEHRPGLLFFSDDLDNPYWGQSYAEYYGIDTIRVGQQTHIRFDLSMRGLDFMKTF